MMGYPHKISGIQIKFIGIRLKGVGKPGKAGGNEGNCDGAPILPFYFMIIYVIKLFWFHVLPFEALIYKQENTWILNINT